MRGLRADLAIVDEVIDYEVITSVREDPYDPRFIYRVPEVTPEARAALDERYGKSGWRTASEVPTTPVSRADILYTLMRQGMVPMSYVLRTMEIPG